jgi:hypothetical protein
MSVRKRVLKEGLSFLIIAYRTNSVNRILFEKLTGSQLIKKYLAFYGTQRFIIGFTNAHHLYLEPGQSTSCLSIPFLEDPFLIFFSHLCLSVASALLPTGLSTKIFYTPFLSPIHATCLTHLILLIL